MGGIEVTKSEVQVPIQNNQGSTSTDAPVSSDQQLDLKREKTWWFSVFICVTFLIIGQSTAKVFQNRYYENGGETVWLRSLVKTGAFPLLILPLLIFYFITPKNHPINNNNIDISISINKPSNLTLFFIYFSLGVLFAAQSMLLSVGIKYTSLFIFSLVSVSQLPFSVLFYFLINRRKFTRWIVISIVLVFISSVLIGLFEFSFEGQPWDSYNRHTNHVLGSLCTLLGSMTFSLYLSLMQLSFEKFIIIPKNQQKSRFGFVLKMQIYTSFVSTIICLIGFLAFEVRDMKNEHENYKRLENGNISFVVTFVGASLGWQIGLIGLVGLVALVSSLFSNIVSMVPFSFITIVAAIYYEPYDRDGMENMDWIKIISMVLAFMGFLSYVYQLYRGDDKKVKVKDSKEFHQLRKSVNASRKYASNSSRFNSV